MKKIGLIVLAFILIVGCSQSKEQKKDAPLKIGISQFVQHPALDNVSKGIMDKMKELGYENVEFDYQNSNADIGTTKQIAAMFKSKKMDMVVGVGTPNAQALKTTITDVPVIYAAITDPLSAGLVADLYKGEKGIAGTSHKTPIKEQLQFLMSLTPVKKLGQIYSGNDDSALYWMRQTKKACDELGLEYVGTAVNSSTEVKQAAETLVPHVDAIFIATDNTVVSALSAVTTTALEHKVPLLSGDPASAKENPVLVAWGFDWYYIGQKTAEIMDQVLKGTPTEDIPTGIISDTSHMNMILNQAVADKIGITFPDDVKAKAAEIREEL